MSVCVQAMTAAKSEEKAPTYATTLSATGADKAYIGNILATRYTPATTIVAAWIRAETGVGPSIASGSQIWNGNIADLPTPPINTKIIDHVIMERPRNAIPPPWAMAVPVGFVRVIKSNVLVLNDKIRIPIRKPRSAKRVTMNAFFEALTAD